MSNKFWKWSNEVSSNNSELILDGPISDMTWWGDEVTPQEFRDELKQHKGDMTVSLNSPGGDVFAGVSIYNALREYDGTVTVRVDGLAASIASIVAMAGDKIIMSPGSMMMIHKPWTMAMGDAEELKKTIEVLDGIQGSLIPIYATRTGMSEEEIVAMLDAETWMTAAEAVDMGFADEAIAAKKSSYSDAIKNLVNGNFAYSMSATKKSLENLAKKIEASEEVEEANVPNTTKTSDEAVKPEPTVEPAESIPPATEPTEPEQEAKATKPVQEETKDMNTATEEIAKSQVMAPADQATVETKPKAKSYLKTKASIEDFANVLRANAGKSFGEVKSAWKEVLVKNGLTDADYFALPEPVVTSIEDAVKTSGIYNALNHTGLDVFKVVWDDADADIDTSRAGAHKKGDTKDEQLLDFDNRVIRAQYIYKYLVLDKETIRENRSTGALVRFVLNELPVRVVREIERAVVIGDGRASGNKRQITSFVSVKSDAASNAGAGNSFATTYTPAADETRYETLVRALDLIEADGSAYLISKKGFLTGLKLETNANGGYVFAPGADVANAIGFAGNFEPTWLKDATDAENDAYIVVLSQYKTVGDNTVEAFTNFKLETNENEFLQEIYQGGALAAKRAAVAIAKPATV